jgi:hypothetical protein
MNNEVSITCNMLDKVVYTLSTMTPYHKCIASLIPGQILDMSLARPPGNLRVQRLKQNPMCSMKIFPPRDVS